MLHFARNTLAAALVAGALAQAAVAQTPITVQIVNDSGLPDDQVYLLLMGAPITVGGTTYPLVVSGDLPSIDTTTTASGTSAPLGCAQGSTGCTPFKRAKVNGAPLHVDSPYSGAHSLPVYEFTATTVGSGVLYISYQQPITAPPAPTVTSTTRFQPVEFTYSQYVASTADLSSIDFYGIPIELTTYRPTDTHFARPLDRVTYYTSTPTLLQVFLATNANLGNAMIATGATGNTTFVPGTTPMADFLRVIGPNQIAAPGSTSPLPSPPPSGMPRVWPYPSFAGYLDSLANASYTFTESDSNLVSGYTYSYTGTVYPMTSTTTDTCLNPLMAVTGWYVKLTGTTTVTSGSLPSNADICIPLPQNNPYGVNNQLANSGNADFIIYGAVQNCYTLGLAVNGVYQSCDESSTSYLQALTNSVYGWIQADVLSALNFGYMNGKWDNTQNGGQGNSAAWYNLPPIQYPFGQARVSNDGYYNPWAALMYNHSDAYGFAFSDRNGRPSPAVSLPTDQGFVRIWILPDTRLDAPLVTATAAGSDTIKLEWPVVSGAHHYIVTWSPPYLTKSDKVDQPTPGTATASYTIKGLHGGTPYTVTVRAVDRTEELASAEVPVYATTHGSPSTPTSGNVDFQFGFNWTPPSYLAQTPIVTLGNATATYGPVTGGMAYTVTGTTPITVAPPASSVAFNVQDNSCSGDACIVQTLSPVNVAAGGTSSLLITIGSPSSSTPSLVATTPFVFSLPPGVTAALGAAPGSTPVCMGVVVNQPVLPTTAGSIVTGANSPLTAGTTQSPAPACVIPVTLTALQSGLLNLGAQSFSLNGTTTNTPVSLTLNIAAPATANIAQAISPDSIPNDGAATLVITVGAPGAAVDLALDFVDILPPNLLLTGIDSSAASACLGVVPAPTQISIPAGTTIPATGCTITANVTGVSAGGGVNTTGVLLLTNTPISVTHYPLVVTSNGDTIWSSNVYLTMIGTPQSFSVGPCTLLDACEGSGISSPVPFDTLALPNFAERLQQPLSITGGDPTIGPPFGGSWVANVGVSFVPQPNKKAAAVTLPTTLHSGNLCPWLPNGRICP